MKKYTVFVSYRGSQEIIVEARNRKEAKAKVENGDYDEKNITDRKEDFLVTSTQEKKERTFMFGNIIIPLEKGDKYVRY